MKKARFSVLFVAIILILVQSNVFACADHTPKYVNVEMHNTVWDVYDNNGYMVYQENIIRDENDVDRLWNTRDNNYYIEYYHDIEYAYCTNTYLRMAFRIDNSIHNEWNYQIYPNVYGGTTYVGDWGASYIGNDNFVSCW